MHLPLRSLTTALVAASALFFAACGSDSTSITDTTAAVPTSPAGDTEASDVPTTVPTTVATTEPTAETGFGQSAADRDRLLATSWSARRFITVGPLDEVPAGSTAGFRFTDETTISVDTGCNTGTGTVTFGPGGTMSIGSLELTEKACADDTEPKLLALFELELVWSVNGDQLTIYPLTVSDLGLILIDADTVEAPPTTTPEQSAAADRADVIAAAVLARVTVDNSFGGQDTFAEIAIVQHFGEQTDDAMLTFEPNAPSLSDVERAAVEAALAPTTVRWTDDPQDPAVLAGQAAGQLDAIVTLSEPEIDGDSATIVTGLFCGSVCGIGGTHELGRQTDGSWVVTGRPGPQWIS